MMADLKNDWYFNLLSEMVTCAQDSSNVNFQSKATYITAQNLVDFRDGTRGVQKQPTGSGTTAQTFPSWMEVRVNVLTSTTKSRPMVTIWLL